MDLCDFGDTISILLSTEKRLRKDDNLAKTYEEHIHDAINNVRSEKVEECEAACNGQVWYLPHHPVIRNDKSTSKVRIIVDGSAKKT